MRREEARTKQKINRIGIFIIINYIFVTNSTNQQNKGNKNQLIGTTSEAFLILETILSIPTAFLARL